MKPVAYIDQDELDGLADGFAAAVTPQLIYDDSHELIVLTPALQELVEAAINLSNVKGRHHSQIAMGRLSKAVKSFKEKHE